MDLQEAFNQPSEEIRLPEGFYKGPVVIRHPCVVYGENATIWSEREPVIEVDAPNVALRGLRVHLMGGEGVCVRTNFPDARLDDVQLNGALEGFPDEDSRYRLPSIVRVKPFAKGRVNQTPLVLDAPAAMSLSHTMHGVEVYPETLEPGPNRAVLTIRDVEDARTLYGPIFAVRPNGVKRVIYISGQSSAYAAPLKLDEDYQPSHARPSHVAQRGERWPLPVRSFRIRLDPPAPAQFDLRPFVFLMDNLLDKNGRFLRDEDLIYFRNPEAETNSVRLEEDSILVNLDRLPARIQNVVVCFAIDEESNALSFQNLQDRSIRFESVSFQRTDCIFPLEDLSGFKTLIAVELYRVKSRGEWKAFFAERGAPCGLKEFIQQRGLEVQQ